MSTSPSGSSDRKARVAARIATARAGIALTVLEGLGLFAYVAMTWSEPHRALGAALAVSACALGVGLAVAPLDKLLSDRWAPVTWLAWSGTLIVATAVGVAFDGGSESPLVVVFVLLLMFAALSYPRRIAVAVCAGDLAACLIALMLSGAEPAYVQLVLCTLMGAAGLCIWQVRRQERHERALWTVSRTDALTGCLNRRAFDEVLATRVAAHARGATPYSLIIFDLDGFKAVNDEFGHATGDELLEWTARAAAAVLRPTDVLARLGGDEFGVILVDAGPEGASATAARLVVTLSERVAVSAGFVTCPLDGTASDELYREADARLYADKRRRADARAALAIPQQDAPAGSRAPATGVAVAPRDATG